MDIGDISPEESFQQDTTEELDESVGNVSTDRKERASLKIDLVNEFIEDVVIEIVADEQRDIFKDFPSNNN